MSGKKKDGLLDLVVLLICVACAIRWLYTGLVASQPTIYLMDVIIGLAWAAAAGVWIVRFIRLKK